MPEERLDLSLGDRLRMGRALKKQTLRQLASEIGKTAAYLSDIENDRRVPSEDVLSALATALDLDVDDLMASAGKIGEQADQYLRRTPQAGILFRRLSESDVSPQAVEELIRQVPNLSKRHDANDH
ncbi:MAG: helix-turn-helix domain-containing protein [Chloroflexota bacterium]|nr:helix-turn-helix domain-containing protein [Chloroflexota bacterium]